MKVEIEPAAPGEVETVLALVRTFYAESGDPFDEAELRRVVARLVGAPELGRIWLFRAGAEAVGYLVVTFGYSLEFRGRDAFVDELFVSEPFRGRGIGTRALAAAEELCREAGVRALHLEVDRANVRAQTLYRAIGYRGHDRYLMTKWLA